MPYEKNAGLEILPTDAPYLNRDGFFFEVTYTDSVTELIGAFKTAKDAEQYVQELKNHPEKLKVILDHIRK